MRTHTTAEGVGKSEQNEQRESPIDEWTNQIHHGDVRETLAAMPADSVHCVMTSPPYYGLRDYETDGQLGLEDSLEEYVRTLVTVGDELRRVLRPDGSWWLNLGDSFAGSASTQRTDTSETNSSQHEHSATLSSPVRPAVLRNKSKMLAPHRVAIALQDAGWIIRADCIWKKPNPMPHPVRDRLNEHKEYVFHLVPESEYWFDLDAVRKAHADSSLDRTNYAFNSAGKGSTTCPREDRTEDVLLTGEQALHSNGKNPGDIFEIAVTAFPDAHFAVFPEALCETPLKATCPPRVCAECGMPYDRQHNKIPV